MAKKDKNKKKKEKVIYYDDNSTISDMSQVTGMHKKKSNSNPAPKPPSSFKDQWRTYWSAVKKMILPMLGVLIILGLLYLLIMGISGNLW